MTSLKKTLDAGGHCVLEMPSGKYEHFDVLILC